MNKEKYQEIYENLKKNSIGTNKRSSNKRNIKKAILNASMASILVTFLSGCSIGLQNSNSNNYTNDKIVEESNFYGYEKGFLKQTEKLDASSLMKNHNLTEFDLIEGKRQYSYSKEEYNNIYALTDSYLYGFYLLTTEDTFSIILSSRGYDSFDDFLIKNGYINSKGEANREMWEIDSLNKAAASLNKLEEERGYSR